MEKLDGLFDKYASDNIGVKLLMDRDSFIKAILELSGDSNRLEQQVGQGSEVKRTVLLAEEQRKRLWEIYTLYHEWSNTEQSGNYTNSEDERTYMNDIWRRLIEIVSKQSA